MKGRLKRGLVMKDYQNQVKALTDEQSRQLRNQMRVQSTLLRVFIPGCMNGIWVAGFKATYTIARRLIRQHLADPAPSLYKHSLMCCWQKIPRPAALISRLNNK